MDLIYIRKLRDRYYNLQNLFYATGNTVYEDEMVTIQFRCMAYLLGFECAFTYKFPTPLKGSIIDL